MMKTLVAMVIDAEGSREENESLERAVISRERSWWETALIRLLQEELKW